MAQEIRLKAESVVELPYSGRKVPEVNDEQLREVDEWRERFQNSALQTKLRLLKRGP